MSKKGRKRRTSERTMRRLAKKREVVVNYLISEGFEVAPNASDKDILLLAYSKFERDLPDKKMTVPGMHSRYTAVIRWAGEAHPFRALGPKPRAAEPMPKAVYSVDDALKFYESYEWRKLRYRILKRDGAQCQLCGATRADGLKLHVDHIKPLRKNWSLRLDPKNLQVLCEVCNHGKGNWDETDWRQQSAGESHELEGGHECGSRDF